VARGAVAAGRRPEEVTISTGVILQVSDDRDLARKEAALQIGFYATTRTYRSVLDRHGLGERVEPLRRAFAKRDYPEMIDLALPMVDALGIAGPVGECRDRLREFEGIADRVILGGAWVGPSEDRLAQNHQAIVGAFAPAR
jgi:alkanesulfonate monooxygenase SsuD/methylene tetrahydromethanopterin reductase-like flavin-dependent oxidoreductase (luciferase family)